MSRVNVVAVVRKVNIIEYRKCLKVTEC